MRACVPLRREPLSELPTDRVPGSGATFVSLPAASCKIRYISAPARTPRNCGSSTEETADSISWQVSRATVKNRSINSFFTIGISIRT